MLKPPVSRRRKVIDDNFVSTARSQITDTTHRTGTALLYAFSDNHTQGFPRIGSVLTGRVGSERTIPTRPVRFRTPTDPTGPDLRGFENLPTPPAGRLMIREICYYYSTTTATTTTGAAAGAADAELRAPEETCEPEP